MVETVQQKNEKSLLPFATLTQTDEASFTKDVERAAIFCLAELDRDKGGGFFKKRPPEKVVFIAQAYYPFWIAPFGDFTLFLDGLNLASYSIPYAILPDSKVFKDKLSISLETRQTYAMFLSNNSTHFQGSGGEETKVIEGLLADVDFFKEFMPYLNEAVATDAPVVDSVLISPAHDEAAVLSITQELEKAHAKFVNDVKELNDLIKLLNQKTQKFLDALRGEIKGTEKKFSKAIQEAKAALEDETAKINREYTEKITETSSKSDQEILAAQKEILTLDKTKDQLAAEIEHCEAEIKTAAVNKDDVTEQKWKEKRVELKKEAPEILTKIKLLTEKITEIEENKKTTVFQLKSENDAKIKEASKELMTLESSRDAEISVFQKEMETLEELTENIIKQINKLAELREATIAEFDNLGVKQKREQLSLVHMPFYLIRYQAGANMRYAFFAPSFVSSLGVGTKLKAMGKMKVSQLFQPRSKKIISVLNKFAVLLGEDVAFSREINEACRKANLLAAENLKQSIAAGLGKLQEDSWLSEQEGQLFTQIL